MTGSLLLLVWAATAGAVDLRALRSSLLLALLVAFVAAHALVTPQRNGLMPCSAGAEWLREARGRWVRTFELTHAIAHDSGPEVRLDLRGHRRAVRIALDGPQQPDVWAHVRNGIPHSIALGARSNRRTPQALDLAPEPHR
ncbi:hypothetical protein GCM10009854_33490 [Saccharopolyspora halophila]|uniref:PH domain-containing protein n=1 Tax=Saccharopolyspora halophila TaxID=405551 RepID=A0ABN3GJI2_9PSEU